MNTSSDLASQPSYVLTIQSHVAFGHVGNSAATLPLQLLGIQPIVVNTVQFSNHTGYGEFKGQVFSASHIKDVLEGLGARGILQRCSAVLSGYLGDADIGEEILKTVEEIRRDNPTMTYLCDPVMGDVGRGVFVRPGIPEFLSEHAVKMASIITPNHFEYELIANQIFANVEEVVEHAKSQIASSKHLKAIIITSLRLPDLPEDRLETLLVTKESAWLIETPYHDLEPLPNGMGDTFSAILLGHLLNKQSITEATQNAVSSLYSLVTHTQQGNRDLPLIAKQSVIKTPEIRFEARKI